MTTPYQDKFRWDGIKNDSGETCPAFGILVITGTEMRGETFKRPVLIGNKPSTTFYREFVVNGPTPIPAGGYGRCTRGPGACSVKYDTGTPASGEGYGPKPGQWTASKGFPGITCEGIKDAGRYLLLGTLGEIGEVFGKPQSDIAAATGATTPSTGTVIVQYFDGTSYQASTFELTGTNILPYKIKSGRLYKWVAVGDQWCAVELASRSWAGSIAGTLSAGGTATVTLSDGTSHTGTNVSGQQIEAGAVLATDDAYTGNMLICGSALPQEGSGGGGGTGLFYCTLSAVLSADQGIANIQSVIGLDGDIPSPEPTTADNVYGRSGGIGDPVLIAVSDGLGVSGYTVVLVWPKEVARVIEGYVYQAFGTDDYIFRMEITYAYQGSWPTYDGSTPIMSLMVNNIPRILDPHDRGAYVFEGEYGATCRAEYDTEASKLSGSHIYRVVWVECPEESPVETSGGYQYSQQPEGPGTYNYGGASPLVSPYYGV